MNRKKIVFIILTFFWVGVIFLFSLQPAEVSGEISSSILQKVLSWTAVAVFEQFETISQDQWNFLHLLLRKCAHFTEFAILGVFSTLTLFQTKVSRKALIAIGFCLAIASMDETLQLFVSGRAGRITDVMIDCAGAGIGVVAVSLKKRNRFWIS